MKKISWLLLVLCGCSMLYAVEPPIVFRGETLPLNTEFTRSQCGKTPTSEMPEISGMSCSRVTPGFLWVQSDENYRVTAITPAGDVRLILVLKHRPVRRDWEGLGTGVWRGKNTIFVGGFGDNSLQYKDNYYIFYFDEPEIPAERTYDSILVYNNYIRYGYPDGKAHNTEALMYDNIDQKLYIIDKEENHFCHVYSLRMDTTYGTDLQILTYECDLGIEGETQFQRVTAADMTPDGRWIIIKNNYYPSDGSTRAYALMWQRESGESLVDALRRQPEQIAAYEVEWQGEAVAWLDSTTFYTTSDEDSGRAPIYKYTRWTHEAFEQVSAEDRSAEKVLVHGQVYIRTREDEYMVTGNKTKTIRK